jgi:hypothetical protein
MLMRVGRGEVSRWTRCCCGELYASGKGYVVRFQVRKVRVKATGLGAPCWCCAIKGTTRLSRPHSHWHCAAWTVKEETYNQVSVVIQNTLRLYLKEFLYIHSVNSTIRPNWRKAKLVGNLEYPEQG